MEAKTLQLEGIILEASYVTRGKRGVIRLTLKTSDRTYNLLDTGFYPYFYLLPGSKNVEASALKGIRILSKENEEIGIRAVDKEKLLIEGKEREVFRITLENPRNVPAVSETFKEFGTCYEDDIVFWKRYLIDKKLSPLSLNIANVHEEDGDFLIDEIKMIDKPHDIPLKYLCFDIETYNPLVIPRIDKDPVIMISYTDGKESKVLTYKKIKKDYVSVYKDEKEMIQAFVDTIKRLDPDIIIGYNSSLFDFPYLMDRAEHLKMNFDVGRYENGYIKREQHGLVQAVRIAGRINLDLYNVARFVSIVGASEKVIKVNSFKLPEVYEAITGKVKKLVNKTNIWEQWDEGGATLDNLGEYSLTDSLALDELYQFFLPIEVEMAKVSHTTLGEVGVSTTSQLVEFSLMGYAQEYKEIIPNKPDEAATAARLANPYEGAYVKTPEAGIYDKIVVFDFRGLYPSIIIAHNIDPATMCTDCTDYFEAPNGVKYRKDRIGTIPMLLKILIDQRATVKKAFKKDPDNKSLAARSTALKILANAVYGYLGYPRARWYSRECASSITAYARLFITQTIEKAEKFGFKVLYSDTDSIFLLQGAKTKQNTEEFLKQVNAALPNTMELELEDFYLRGVFVGKRGTVGGAKKKYALLSEGGRIKIKGFELVRRDWSKVARDAQRAVLEAILKEGSKDKAVKIVKDTVAKLKEGKVELGDLAIHTQLRKGMGSYDIKSPELAAAKKALQQGVRTKEELEGAAIGYVITRHGNSISERAEIEETAKDYDPDYYINHQVLPATLKILKELGISEEELVGAGSQKRLG